MIFRSRIYGLVVATLLSLCLFAACDGRDIVVDSVSDDPDAGLPVTSQMALSLRPGDSSPATKMLDAITQIEANSDRTAFRGIEEMFIIPFKTHETISASDARAGRNLSLPHKGITTSWGTSANDGNNTGLVTNNNSHLYKNVLFKAGTASVLAYGKSIDDSSVSATPSDSVAFKRRNGVLHSHGLQDADIPDDIGFTLEPIATDATETAIGTKISGIIAYLNNIAGAVVSHQGYTYRTTTQTTWTYTWANAATYNSYATLTNAFETLTGNGVMFSGSSSGIERMLTSIYNGLYNIANSSSVTSNDYNQPYYGYYSRTVSGYYYYVYELARDIRNRIANSTYVTTSGSGNNVTISFKDNYANMPGMYGLPDGAVAIQWNSSSFTRVTADNSTLAPTNAYCYPPCLWYWTNSTLKTSDNGSVVEEYKSANATWADILNNYTYGSTVLPGVESTAITKPLQYGVAQLKLNLAYAESVGGTNQLLDSSDQTIAINNSNFPLTGVLISDQRNLGFNFAPKTGSSYCVYDTEVNDGTSPKAWIAHASYASTNLTFKPVYTLVVQSDSNQDVHYALEFQNNSGAEFYGVNGCVVAPGNKFYLTGILTLTGATSNPGINSIFLQDHVTEITVKVQSLKKAYNTIPELRDPQLEIGVQTEMRWVGSTPANIALY